MNQMVGPKTWFWGFWRGTWTACSSGGKAHTVCFRYLVEKLLKMGKLDVRKWTAAQSQKIGKKFENFLCKTQIIAGKK